MFLVLLVDHDSTYDSSTGVILPYCILPRLELSECEQPATSVVAEIAFCIQKFFKSIQKDRRIQIKKNLLYTKNIFCIQKIYFVYKRYFSYIEKHVLYLITFLKNLFVYKWNPFVYKKYYLYTN